MKNIYNKLYEGYEIILFKIIFNYFYYLEIFKSYILKKNVEKRTFITQNIKLQVNYDFLLIEYIIPNNRIIIKLSKKELYVGNEILSKDFIFNYLKNNNIDKYIFLDYKLNILDENIKEICLDKNSYLLLKKDTYIIMNTIKTQ
jgi:hypothetical protein